MAGLSLTVEGLGLGPGLELSLRLIPHVCEIQLCSCKVGHCVLGGVHPTRRGDEHLDYEASQ